MKKCGPTLGLAPTSPSLRQEMDYAARESRRQERRENLRQWLKTAKGIVYLHELFGVQPRDGFKINRPAKQSKALRCFFFRGHGHMAATKSEARAHFKALLGLSRLPAGARIDEIKTSS